MRRILLLFIAIIGIICAFPVQAQIRSHSSPLQVKKVIINQLLADVEQQQLLQVLPLFMIKGDSVHQPIDISADKPGMKLNIQKIVPPKGISNGIHAYGFSYHQHGNLPFPNHTLIFVERPSGLQTQSTRVWADANHDLDFTNDSSVVFNPFNPCKLALDIGNQPYAIELSLFGPKEFTSFQSMYKTAIDLIRGERVYFGTQFSFREKRLNTAYGGFEIDGDSIYIGIKDINSNGSFADKGVDRVILSPSLQRFELDNSLPLTEKMRLNWLGKSFEVSMIQEDRALEIKIDPNYKPSRRTVNRANSLLVGQRMPNVKFCMASKKNNAFSKTKKRIRSFKPQSRRGDSLETLIVVWNSYDKQWDKDSTYVHQLARIPKNGKVKMNVIMLNFGGSGKYVYRYNQRYELNNVTQGFCSATLARKLKIQTMPQYFLLDSRFRIKAINPKLLTLTHP